LTAVGCAQRGLPHLLLRSLQDGSSQVGDKPAASGLCARPENSGDRGGGQQHCDGRLRTSTVPRNAG